MSDMRKPPKNIVICCDGTGNQFGARNSNVVKLYTCLKVEDDQIAYYHPGVGTMGAPNKTGVISRNVSRILGLAFGAGFNATVEGAYQYLMEWYAEGDQVYLFGFSRGSYAVRALASAIYAYGLLCPGNEGHLPYLMNMLSKASKDAYGKEFHPHRSNPDAAAFKETFSRPMPIRFMGIWDTVSSIGWAYDPIKLIFDESNPIVQSCRHAVSLDERRCYFQAALWGKPLASYRDEKDEETNNPQDFVQAWFAGVHSDVGGSYPQAECAPAMDAFRWMLGEAKDSGLILKEGKTAAVLGATGTGFPSIEKENKPPAAEECFHRSLTPAYWILEVLPHTYIDAEGKKHWQLAPWAHRRVVPDGALLHPTLLGWLGDEDYKPKNLNKRYVKLCADSPPALPDRKQAQRLIKEGFGVYRLPVEPSSQTNVTLRAAAAAVFAAGLAWSLWRKLSS